MRLTIKHTGNGPEEPLFSLTLGENTAERISLPDPASWPVEGYDGGLLKCLQWYLEDYLTLPVGANATMAAAVVAALEAWGAAVFDALFDRDTFAWYQPYRDRPEELQIRIVSGSPAVLAWPWEAMCDTRRSGDKTGVFLAPHCCLERQPDAHIPEAGRPRKTDLLRMLLVIARPYGDNDVGYHALAREMVDYVRKQRLPVEISVLRPPTFENLQRTLRRAKEEGKPIHIVHFDGHGGYGEQPAGDRRNKFQGAEGCLVFETAPPPGGTPEPDLVWAGDLGQMLHQCGVSMAVLNACQSAMIDARANDAYASVAATLLGSGIRSVTAMGYSLYVSGAKKFVPAFYEGLFRNGSPAEAMRDGRRAMYNASGDSVPGGTPLRDWLVPQLYQLLPANAKVLPNTKRSDYEPESPVWPEDALEPGEYGFIGRGQDIQTLERMLLRRTAAGIVVHGMAGAGKTTLVKGFLSWLRDTGGLWEADGTLCPVFWFDFRDIHSGYYIVEMLAAQLLEGGEHLRPEEKLRRVARYLREHRTFLVWDNFESATVSSDPEEPQAALPPEDRAYLKTLLEQLNGGKSRVLLTSRTKEEWLGGAVTPLRGDLNGLQGDELWTYAGLIAERMNVEISPTDPAMQLLMEKLGGNPLAIQAVLSRLPGSSAAALAAELDEAFPGAEGDESTARIRAAFRVVMRSADADMAPILQTLGLFEHFADVASVITVVGNLAQVEPGTPEAQDILDAMHRSFTLLESAGLCAHQGQGLYRLHPALRGCLAAEYPAPEEVRRWFVLIMNHMESQYHNDIARRRGFFFYHEANIRRARALAEALALREEELELTFALAVAASDSGSYAEAGRLWLQLAERARQYGDPFYENKAYAQLHVLAGRQGDEASARRYAEMAADVWKNAEAPRADVYFDLGMAAYQRGDLEAAVGHFERALAIWEPENNPGAISLYGILGNVAAMQGDRDAARTWMQKTYHAAKTRGDKASLAGAALSLAALAKNENDYTEAEKRYIEALELFSELGNELGLSQTRWALGNMFLRTGRTRAARDQFKEALLIARRLKVTKEVADNYEGLGHAAAMEGQLKVARDWWDQALEMYEGLGDEKHAADIRENLKKLDLAERRARGEADPAEAIPEPPAELLQLLSEHPELLKLLDAEADPEAIKQLLRLLGGSEKEE